MCGYAHFNRRGNIEAAISVSGPSLRFSTERIEEIAAVMNTYVKKIQERL